MESNSIFYASVLLNILFLLGYLCVLRDNNDDRSFSSPSLKNINNNLKTAITTDSSNQLRRLSVLDPKTVVSKVSSSLPTESDEEVMKLSRAQMQQDQFLYMNYFRGVKNGVFLDVGANNAEFISNTFMFEKGLDWTGICFEPNTEYHADWATKRSCRMIKKMVAGFDMKNPDYITLSEVLDDNGMTHIDFISLDVEGKEIEILEKFDFKKYDVSVWLIETFWLDDRHVDHIMLTNGYYKVSQLAIDAVYVKIEGQPLWQASKELGNYWPEHQKWRCHPDTQALIKSKTALTCEQYAQ